MDDYGHIHRIRATLDGASVCSFPSRCVCFQPHRTTRAPTSWTVRRVNTRPRLPDGYPLPPKPIKRGHGAGPGGRIRQIRTPRWNKWAAWTAGGACWPLPNGDMITLKAGSVRRPACWRGWGEADGARGQEGRHALAALGRHCASRPRALPALWRAARCGNSAGDERFSSPRERAGARAWKA